MLIICTSPIAPHPTLGRRRIASGILSTWGSDVVHSSIVSKDSRGCKCLQALAHLSISQHSIEVLEYSRIHWKTYKIGKKTNMTNIFILAQLIWRVPVVRRQLSWVHPSWTQRALLEFLLRCPESYQCENDKMISRNIGFHEATSIVATGTTTCFFLILASLGGRCRSRVGLMTSSRKAFLSKHHTSESCMLSTAGGYPMKGRHVLGSIPNIKDCIGLQMIL